MGGHGCFLRETGFHIPAFPLPRDLDCHLRRFVFAVELEIIQNTVRAGITQIAKASTRAIRRLASSSKPNLDRWNIG